MKPPLWITVFALVGSPAFAQSQAAADHGSEAVRYTGAAAAESTQAAVAAAAGSLRLTSKIAAVPLWLAGSAAVSAGATVSAVGSSAAAVGASAADAARQTWDFSSGDPASRPSLDPSVGLPPAPVPPAPPPHDPSPAEMLKQNQR
ncbi:hypothetical protein K0B96_11980 [Horticoccus luteus]|uniref:Uncharacterized protein n=1 Tax=Horticoccus luteus TaxID=2862869 RepID=A0A8F9TTX4_9BACT|nr:hypothetical protein [Horticoccus luteus]QYM78027.1 hypothetical protein K0B96_11980 [Horticoccus luteus]